MSKYLFLSIFLISQFSSIAQNVKYKSDELVIHQLTDHVFVHETFLNTQDYGRVSCNGMIYVSNGEAILFDTPAEIEGANELIKYVKDSLQAKISYVVPTHFHNDCLGSLNTFHQNGIQSISSKKTKKLAKANDSYVPQLTFKDEKKLTIGSKDIILKHYGEGHTKDNVVAYIPSENALFGGCLVKRVNAGKGYLGDANTNEWSNTIRSIKSDLSDLEIVVPGHGPWGGEELLDYTIELFDIE